MMAWDQRITIEQELLGHLVSNPDALELAGERLALDDFADAEHRRIYDIAACAYAQLDTISPRIVAARCGHLTFGDGFKLRDYVFAVYAAKYSSSNVSELINTLIGERRAPENLLVCAGG